MQQFLKSLFWIRGGIRKKLGIVKKSYQDPFLYFKIFTFILFCFVLFGINFFNNPFFISPSGDLSIERNNQSLFLESDLIFRHSPDLFIVQGAYLRAASSPSVITPRAMAVLTGISEWEETEGREEIIEYIVQPGDNLWSIAVKFGISQETLIWANELRGTIIRPGQTLLVLPVSGIKHVVRTGETISEIAKRYNVVPGEIITFNRLSPQGDIFVGQALVVPGGAKPLLRPTDRPIRELTPSEIYARFSTNNFFGQSHPFPFGQCTWWVAQRRAIPAWGHARDWLPNAQAAGLQTCRGRYCIPKPGAVIIVRGDPVFGHVGYVERVRGTKITFSEMNNIGWGRVNERTLRIGNLAIIGYIY